MGFPRADQNTTSLSDRPEDKVSPHQGLPGTRDARDERDLAGGGARDQERFAGFLIDEIVERPDPKRIDGGAGATLPEILHLVAHELLGVEQKTAITESVERSRDLERERPYLIGLRPGIPHRGHESLKGSDPNIYSCAVPLERPDVMLDVRGRGRPELDQLRQISRIDAGRKRRERRDVEPEVPAFELPNGRPDRSVLRIVKVVRRDSRDENPAELGGRARGRDNHDLVQRVYFKSRFASLRSFTGHPLRMTPDLEFGSEIFEHLILGRRDPG